ncbi:hypothetical protein V6615_05215 [Oscillospiraceae bacterium PP1C4]
MAIKYVPEPFRIKMVETIKMLTKEERTQKIKEANYNMFNLKGEDCYIDHWLYLRVAILRCSFGLSIGWFF